MLFDHWNNDLVFLSIFYLGLLKVLFDHGINDLVLVICVPLEMPYLGLVLGYLLGLILLCLKKIPCLTEKLCCCELLICNSSSRVILVTCWPLRSQLCCIRRVDGIHLGTGRFLFFPVFVLPNFFFFFLGGIPFFALEVRDFSPHFLSRPVLEII